MYRKNIRTITRKQLKKEYPNWNRLTKKDKKHCFRNWPAHGKKQYSQKKRPTDSASLCCLRFPYAGYSKDRQSDTERIAVTRLSSF